MINLKVDTQVLKDDFGILYLLYLWHDDKKLVKIGLTRRDNIVDRVIEILISYYTQYRVFPRLYPKRYRRTSQVAKKEQQLHKHFSKQIVSFDKTFSGCKEFFYIEDEEMLLKVYEDII